MLDILTRDIRIRKRVRKAFLVKGNGTIWELGLVSLITTLSLVFNFISLTAPIHLLERWPELQLPMPCLHTAFSQMPLEHLTLGISQLLLQAQFGELAYAFVSPAENCRKWSCSDTTDSRKWSAKLCYVFYLQTREKMSKLHSETLE